MRQMTEKARNRAARPAHARFAKRTAICLLFVCVYAPSARCAGKAPTLRICCGTMDKIFMLAIGGHDFSETRQGRAHRGGEGAPCVNVTLAAVASRRHVPLMKKLPPLCAASFGLEGFKMTGKRYTAWHLTRRGAERGAPSACVKA